MDVVFETRFSFFGQSGWKSAAAADPNLLFDPPRMDERLKLFERITLPSLQAQEDEDFTHMVLSSTLMPNEYKIKLRELVKDMLGDKRSRVMFRPKGSAGQMLRAAVQKGFGQKRVAQVVLDDDDAVSKDFTAELRRHAKLAQQSAKGQGHREDYAYLSFPRGFTLGIEDGRPGWLERRFVPYTNLALTLVGPASTRRNPYMVSHLKVGMRHPSMMVTHLRPYYLRSVHEHNDSRARVQKNGLKPGDIDQARDFFPFLKDYFEPEQQTAAE